MCLACINYWVLHRHCFEEYFMSVYTYKCPYFSVNLVCNTICHIPNDLINLGFHISYYVHKYTLSCLCF